MSYAYLSKAIAVFAALIALAFLAGCTQEPQVLSYEFFRDDKPELIQSTVDECAKKQPKDKEDQIKFYQTNFGQTCVNADKANEFRQFVAQQIKLEQERAKKFKEFAGSVEFKPSSGK